MKYIIVLEDKKYEVTVEKGQAEVVRVPDAVAAPVAPAAAAPAAPVAAAPAAPVGAGKPIVAPMPGNILKVNCQNGSAVKAGDILFVLEAMKMENEILAPHDGTITSVVVAKGATVDTNAVLGTLA